MRDPRQQRRDLGALRSDNALQFYDLRISLAKLRVQLRYSLVAPISNHVVLNA